MTAQNVSPLIYEIKEKITDKEFKDIMDALGVVHKDEEKQDVYLFKYYKMELDIGRMDNGRMGNRLKYKYKERKVILEGCIKNRIERENHNIMDSIKAGMNYEFYIIKNKKDREKYPKLCIAHKNITTLEPMSLQNDDDDDDDDEDDYDKLVYLEYNDIIPISIEKL